MRLKFSSVPGKAWSLDTPKVRGFLPWKNILISEALRQKIWRRPARAKVQDDSTARFFGWVPLSCDLNTSTPRLQAARFWKSVASVKALGNLRSKMYTIYSSLPEYPTYSGTLLDHPSSCSWNSPWAIAATAQLKWSESKAADWYLVAQLAVRVASFCHCFMGFGDQVAFGHGLAMFFFGESMATLWPRTTSRVKGGRIPD